MLFVASSSGEMIIPMIIGFFMHYIGNVTLMWLSFSCILVVFIIYLFAIHIGKQATLNSTNKDKALLVTEMKEL